MNTGSTRVGAEAVAVKGWLKAHRFLIARRASQAGILGLFLLGPIAGLWVVKGNLNSSLTLGVLPLTDPYVLLQSFVARHWPETTAILGAIIVAVFYALVGGRVYCSWVCPVNLVTDAAAWLRRRLGLHGVSRLPRATRQGLLLATFAVSAVAGVVAWEVINPVSMFHRGLIFGVGFAWIVVLAVFLLDAFVSPRSWCGKLCPVGAFYGHLGYKSLVRVRADERARCDDCGDCYDVCPEPQVILPALKGARKGMGPAILDIACTNCGRCIDVCSKEVFVFGTRLRNEVPRINQPGELMEVAPMKKPMTITLAVLLATISTALFSPLSGAETAGVQTLRAVDVAVPDQPPEEKVQLGAKPGAQKPIARTFQQQPPLISHATTYFDEITLEENQCLSCHDVANYKKKEAPKIGKNHFIDLNGKVQKTVSRSRYVCSQCHVPQTDALPLVENTFRAVPVTAAKGK